ncbi:MAG: hypothetical protein IJC27_03125, partial [Lentisphaeria bacterium]|nr:hypothetical protein [Lentisphaeria bacterium]
AAEGETLRHMSRTTTTHAYHLPVQNPACAGARGAGGGVSTPAKKTQVLQQPRSNYRFDLINADFSISFEITSFRKTPSKM